MTGSEGEVGEAASAVSWVEDFFGIFDGIDLIPSKSPIIVNDNFLNKVIATKSKIRMNFIVHVQVDWYPIRRVKTRENSTSIRRVKNPGKLSTIEVLEVVR